MESKGQERGESEKDKMLLGEAKDDRQDEEASKTLSSLSFLSFSPPACFLWYMQAKQMQCDVTNSDSMSKAFIWNSREARENSQHKEEREKQCTVN